MKQSILLLLCSVCVVCPFSVSPKCVVWAATNYNGNNNNNNGRYHDGNDRGNAHSSSLAIAPVSMMRMRGRVNRYAARLRGGASVDGFAETVLDGSGQGHPDSDEKDKKGGKIGLFSVLSFSYVSSLMKVAKTKRLETSDATQLEIPKAICVKGSVTEFSKIYHDLRDETMKNVAKKGGDALEAGKSPLILAKALLIYQKENLLKTGILRLLNTLVQAFPALFVARLLRLVEAGAPIKSSIQASGALLFVLLLKMITENQYFHRSVQSSSHVRGILSGLIFDKSLSLPGGGSDASVQNLKKDSKKKTAGLGVGGVINLMQSDASIIESAFLQLHTFWDGPLQISIYTSLLIRYLGPSALYGIFVLLFTIPLNAVTLRILTRLRKKENLAKDARNKKTTECIMNMKLMKLQGWEEEFETAIQIERNSEMRRHLRRGSIRALNSAISNTIPTIVLVVTLSAYARSGRPMVASTIFTAISLLNQLRFPLLFYPMLIDSLANGTNALRRVSRYLASEELTPYIEKNPSSSDGVVIEMKNGNFLWSPKSGSGALCDANLVINPGEIVAVIGQVGSGKTALIKSLLGELQPVPRMIVDKTHAGVGTALSTSVYDLPTVKVNGQVSYYAQEPWLQKGSIKENILFGRPYNEIQYRSAIRDAGLEADIIDYVSTNSTSLERVSESKGMLSHDTDVSEGGSALSGGQRARVALARALYDRRASIYLLDDPFAALDATVGLNVFDSLLKRLRGENAAAVLVTNDPVLPRRCDRVILMGKSQISTSPECSTIIDIGTYEELLSRGHDIQSISTTVHDDGGDTEALHSHANKIPSINSKSHDFGRIITMSNDTMAISNHADPDIQVSLEHEPDVMKNVGYERRDDDSVTRHVDSESRSNGQFEGSEVTKEPYVAPVIKLSSVDDEMASGSVPKSTYVTYFKSVKKPAVIVFMVLSYIFANSAQFFQQFIIAKWTEIGSGGKLAQALHAKYLRSLVQAAGVVSVFLWLRSYLTLRMGARASTTLHNRLLNAVIGAPLSFFDATPSGQLLSRFGKELDVVDRSLPDQIGSVLYCFSQIAFSCAALAGAVTPVMLAPLALLGLVYVNIITRFRPAAMDLKRCESKSRAPIYTQFSEALKGVETIRSVSEGRQIWSEAHREFTNDNLSVFNTVKSLDRWLSFRLEFLGNLVVFSVSLASILLSKYGKLASGSAGWGLTQALSITGLLNWAVRCLTDFETQMMSVLRITEITGLDSSGKIPKEKKEPGAAMPSIFKEKLGLSPSSKVDRSLLQTKWPWRGFISFRNVSLKYNSASPLVLKKVSIDVPPGSTLGVVGRTGSGKSSLLLALFRIVEIENDGSISIDGIDIRSIGLKTLRQSLSIIPQEPILFAGTLLFNLDATGKVSEEEAWEALNKASPELMEEFKGGNGLNTIITEGGKNFSVGERQIICLARALLRKSKILVLDEATSSVDSKTDKEIQETIRKEFVEKGVTVITVAHRLETVLGNDKIVVLGNGQVLEYGTPSSLLRRSNGELRKLVDDDVKKRRSADPVSI